MAPTDRHLVVDGSNIATEGRTLPSLSQLDEAVQAINAEYEYDSLTVVVDATFAHRIDQSEREELEAAILAGEIVTPPAGAIGRGDAFILQVAEKVGAIVFSNDSFQEFHGDHDWLFDQGRLIGGKPIEGVGWVFVERAPVRGPASRRAVRDASGRSSGGRGGGRGRGTGGGGRWRSRSTKKSARTSTSAEASGPPPKPSKANPPPKKTASKAKPKKGQAKASAKAAKAAKKATAKAEAATKPSTSGKRQQGSSVELNDPISFVRFVSAYSIGDEVEGVVERFSSHGCYLRAADALCYLPSRAMGDPPPTRARDVVSQGQSVIVTIESLDSDRRGINVVLVRAVSNDGKGKPNERNPDSGVDPNQDDNPAIASQKQDPAADSDGAQQGQLTRSSTNVATAKPARKRARKTAAKKAAKKRAVKTASKSTAKATSSARVKRATATRARKSTAKKSTAKKTGAKKTTKKAAAKKTATKKTGAKKTTKKAAAKKTATKKSPAKKTTAKKTTAKKTAAKKTTKKAASNKTAAKKTTKKAAAKKR